jgi:hypothetical protein
MPLPSAVAIIYAAFALPKPKTLFVAFWRVVYETEQSLKGGVPHSAGNTLVKLPIDQGFAVLLSSW